MRAAPPRAGASTHARPARGASAPTQRLIASQTARPCMGWEHLPTMEEYKIDLVARGMERIASGRRTYTKDHLAPARAALDEICRTGDYDFGIRLFKELERRFTDLRDDLGYMRLRIQDLRDARSR